MSIGIRESHDLALRRTYILISEYVVLTRILVIDSATYVGNSRKEDGSHAKRHEQISKSVGENTGSYSYLHVYNSFYIRRSTHMYSKRKLQ